MNKLKSIESIESIEDVVQRVQHLSESAQHDFLHSSFGAILATFEKGNATTEEIVKSYKIAFRLVEKWHGENQFKLNRNEINKDIMRKIGL